MVAGWRGASWPLVRMTLDEEGFAVSSAFRWLTGMLRFVGGIRSRRFAWAEVSEIYRVHSNYWPAFTPPGLLFEVGGSRLSWWSRTEAEALKVLEAVEALAPPGKLVDREIRDRP
jgi:hypothetical protein